MQTRLCAHRRRELAPSSSLKRARVDARTHARVQVFILMHSLPRRVALLLGFVSRYARSLSAILCPLIDKATLFLFLSPPSPRMPRDAHWTRIGRASLQMSRCLVSRRFFLSPVSAKFGSMFRHDDDHGDHLSRRSRDRTSR